MRILFVCHRFPFPPRRGGKIRPFNMIRHLSLTHEVTVASLARSVREAEEGRGLADYCAHFEVDVVQPWMQATRMVARLPTRVPSSVGYFHTAGLAARIRALLVSRPFDLVMVHCSSVAHYVERASVPKILDFGDMDSQKWLEYARYKAFPASAGYWLEGRKLVAEEKRLARRFDFCTATTRAEWETLEAYGTGTPTDWFPNGVDADYFAPAREPYDPNRVSFVGRMDYYPNQQAMLEFCANVWPMLRARRPTLRLAIVGADPPTAIRALAELPGVTVTGSVPDVRPHLLGAALTIAPLAIARGTQNKILESMALGVPVVASTLAAGGVDAVPGEHLLTARTPADYAAAILRIVENRAERARLAQAGRARVLSHHHWTRSMQRLDAIVERTLAGRASRRAAPGAGEHAASRRDDQVLTNGRSFE